MNPLSKGLRSEAFTVNTKKIIIILKKPHTQRKKKETQKYFNIDHLPRGLFHFPVSCYEGEQISKD